MEKEVHARCPSRGAMFRVRPAHIAGTRWNAALTAEYDSADSYYLGRHKGEAIEQALSGHGAPSSDRVQDLPVAFGRG